MPDIALRLFLSSDRNRSGRLHVSEVRSGRQLAEFEALGRGSQGPGDTQLQVQGNTPVGEYRVERIETTTNWAQSSYGPNGALRLTPHSGNAEVAERVARRRGLLIHGGSVGGGGYWRGEGELRATHGCVRLRNEDMRRLVAILSSAQSENSSGAKTIPLQVSLSVSDHNMSVELPIGFSAAPSR
ncbi:MAG: L,D-transpeptidase [Gammaproteobacteria bacterium]|nr:L,D-transpeptidase [Gammaproteobacteria bacterium]